jgi:DNA-binding transcriptional MerR regulator
LDTTLDAIHSISAASKLSGVPSETIRIWERRYGLLEPSRTEGGHRKYSDDDVELLRALKSLTDGGTRIGSLKGAAPSAIRRAASRLQSGPRKLDDLVSEAVAAGRARDSARLADILDRPLLVGRSTEIALELFVPLLRRVGDLWHAGELDIATEHFIEKQVTARLHTMLLNQSRGDGPEGLLACPAGERHEGGLLAAGVVLAKAGFSLSLLGADLPFEEAAKQITRRPPRVVVLSATVPPADDEVEAWKRFAASDAGAGVAFVVGGPARDVFASPHIRALDTLDELQAFARALSR